MLFFESSEKTEKMENSSQQVESAPPFSDRVASAINDARKKLSKTSKGTEGESKTTTGTPTRGSLSKSAQEQIAKMFDPDAWRGIVRAPFTLGKVITGRSCWELEKKEEDILATSTSATAEYFLQTDPKWVCLTIFAFNWATILGQKYLANEVLKKQEQQEMGLKDPLKVVK